MHAERAVPAGTNFPKGKLKVFLFYFLYFTKSRSCRGAAKEFKFVCAKLFFGWADSRFGKPRISFLEGFNFVREKPPLRRAESRFGKPRCSRQGKRFYSFRLYEKNQKYPKGLRPSGLPGTIQSSVEEYYSKVLRRHKPKPVFRTKRWRKGFESVRGSGVTA